jgi:hypothetical protein
MLPHEETKPIQSKPADQFLSSLPLYGCSSRIGYGIASMLNESSGATESNQSLRNIYRQTEATID